MTNNYLKYIFKKKIYIKYFKYKKENIEYLLFRIFKFAQL